MRIVLDVGGALGPASGIRRYAEELLRGLAAVDTENQYVVYAGFWRDFPRLFESFAAPKSPNFTLAPERVPQSLVLKAESRLGVRIQERLLAKHRPDVVHGLANTLPPLAHARSVVTLHHVGGMETASAAWDRFYFDELTGRSVAAAGKVIAVSEKTRAEALAKYGLAPEKVVKVWEGGAAESFKTPADPALLRGLGLSAPYLLFVSAIEARKNLGVLVDAYAKALATKDLKHSLVLVGRKSASYRDLRAKADALGLHDRVRFIEGVDSKTLNAVYRGADLFVYPSLLEGFGLPVLEAMTCGVPVLVADASCLPEIAGDAAVLFDGTSPDALAKEILRVLGDPGLRADLVAKGKARAALFDWRETALKTIEVYRSC